MRRTLCISPMVFSADQLLMLRDRAGLSFGWAETIIHSHMRAIALSSVLRMYLLGHFARCGLAGRIV